ncbi:MAG: ATP-dependent helicase HrpB [Myxococcota bacterium]|jgi:hypothetical protein|nr:ATP-dependent helicase HrpB [Myxococcota bacterium]
MSGITGSGNPAQMLQQVQQIQQQATQPNEAQGAGQSQFSNMVNKAGGAEATGKVESVQGMDIVAEAQKADTARLNQVKDLIASRGAKVNAPGKAADGGLEKLFGGVMDGQGKLDKIIKLATSGRSFSPTELIAVQAGVYKFSQELELTSKVVEKATSGIKQTLQTQV